MKLAALVATTSALVLAIGFGFWVSAQLGDVSRNWNLLVSIAWAGAAFVAAWSVVYFLARNAVSKRR